MSVSTSSTLELVSSGAVTISGDSGISFGESYVHGFEKGTGIVGDVYPTEIYLNTMTGIITSEVMDLASGATDEITLHNTRITANSIVFVTPIDSAGCQPVVYQAVPSTNWVDIAVKNVSGNACTQAYKLGFMVVN
eukprot:CCRYP_000987-RA/>CCRYP_000987-RA protein AED:0.47 eAED:0.47 QI:282/1/1/1/0/0/2/83/135